MKSKLSLEAFYCVFSVCLAILQRVTSASVTVDKKLIASIGRGILVFAAVGPNDTRKDAETAASRVVKLKMWPDETNSGVGLFLLGSLFVYTDFLQWKKSVQDIGGEILCGMSGIVNTDLVFICF